MKTQWRPSANLSILKTRAQFLADIRRYFDNESVFEVDVPTLAEFTVTDPNIESIQATRNNTPAFLQTSPEFFMKRLLAAGSGDIYYLGKAFRDNEYGSKHNCEFTMLEWYRVGFNETQLIDYALKLVFSLLPQAPVTKISYRALFEHHFSINPHAVELSQLKTIANQFCNVSFDSDDPDLWLNLLFTHVVEPAMSGWFVVYDFPESQGALAKKATNKFGDFVAKRFELYCNGLELGNGYWELTNAEEQRQRFEHDIKLREINQVRTVDYDKYILEALEHGMPECAGIAMGVDRLLMIKCGLDNIKDVTPFTYS